MQQINPITDNFILQAIAILERLDANKIKAAPTIGVIPDEGNVIIKTWLRTGRAMVNRNFENDTVWREPATTDSQPHYWKIVEGGEPGIVRGGSKTETFEQLVTLRYTGMNEQGLHCFPYVVERKKDGDLTNIVNMHGVAVLQKDGTLATLVFDVEHDTADLPKKFREVSLWVPAEPTLG